MNVMILIAIAIGTVIVVCAILLAIDAYCEGRYGDNPVGLFYDYFYTKGERKSVAYNTPMAKALREVGKSIAKGIKGQEVIKNERNY